MQYLRDVAFVGDERDHRAVIQCFGRVSFESLAVFMDRSGSPGATRFTVRRFRNWYTDSAGEKPLFCLVPNQQIACVWPDDLAQYRDVKLGTSSPKGERSNVPIVAAFCLQRKDGVGLYLCLDPRGALLSDDDNFGI